MGFGPAKTVKFDTLSMVSQTQSCQSESSFSSTEHLELVGWVIHWKLHRFGRIDKQKCIYLVSSKSKKCIIFQAEAVIKIYDYQHCSTGYCIVFWEANTCLSEIFFDIFENKVLTVSGLALDTMRNKNKQTNKIITTYKEFLGTCIKSQKKNIYTACIR